MTFVVAVHRCAKTSTMIRFIKPGPGKNMLATDLLENLPYFKGLSAEEVERIADKVTQLKFSDGEIIFLEGEPCEGLFVVKSGEVRIFKSSPEGREQVMLRARQGDSFNDVPIFDGGPNPASASAVADTIVYLIPKEVVLSTIGDNPAAKAILKLFASRLRHLSLMVEDLSFRTVISRLAKLLLDQAVVEDGPSPVKRLTQAEMAAMVGSVRDVVGRALKHLEKSGLIKIKGARILVVRPDELRKLL